jgi:hypothetical protein
LDADRDGRLSAGEIRGAPAALLSLDDDDDRVVAPRELASLRDQLAAADPDSSARLRDASRYAAIYLDADRDVDRVHYLLQDAYAPRQDFGPKSFPGFPELFAQLDANGDRWLEKQEMENLFTLEAHLELAVAFDQDQDKPRATVRVVRRSAEVTEVGDAAPDRIVLAAGGARLLVSAHDLGASAAAAPAMAGSQVAGRRQIRLMVHDQSDALFDALDANGDMRLGEREIAFCADAIRQRDANRDGRIAEDEVPYSLVAAFLRGEPAGEQSFYAPPAAPRNPTAAQAPPWFVRADLNGDGDVSRREFLGSREQFGRLDADADGYLGSLEVIAYSSEEDRAG